MKIIAVDDEPWALEDICGAVKEAVPEAELVSFSASSSAAAFAEKNQVDTAFLDISMPEKNGIALARQLKKYNPRINIIFVTAYGEYGVEACQLFASGYLLKPVQPEQVAEQMENLRYSPQKPEAGVRIVTFGEFQVLVEGRTLYFARSKSRELLAYLVDCRGKAVNRRKMAKVLFGEEEYSMKVQDYLNKAIRELTKTLKEAGAQQILVRGFNSYAVDRSRFSCDLYEYLAGSPQAINAFCGIYLPEYSWAENTLGSLYE